MTSGTASRGQDSDSGVAPPERRVPAGRRGNSAQTRSRLLESARHLADTRSVPDFTVEDVASGAGVSRAAFYMHFDNKLAICEEVARTSQATFLAAATSFSREGGIRSVIDEGIAAYVRGFRGDRPGMRMLYELAYADSEVRTLVHDMRARMYETWESEFGTAVATKECSAFDVPLVSRLLVGMLETFCVRTTRTNEYAPTSALGSDAVETIAELWARSVGLVRSA